MRGIADEHDAANMPIFDVHPLHSRTVDLFVALQSGQVFPNEFPEGRKAIAKPFKPTLQRIVGSRLRDIAEAISAPLADGT